jgi:threonine/homoserine/homoserine lactone efflux protein
VPDFPTLIVFVSATIALLVVPGPAVLFVVARSVEQGWRAGVMSAVGLSAGAGVHILAAAVGLSAIVARSATVFSTLRYVGAAYLMYLGLRLLLEADEDGVANAPAAPRTNSMLVAEGFFVNILNPKAALFFFAFLPQFVDPSRGSATLQVFFLGGVFLAIAMITDTMFAVVAGSAGEWLATDARSRTRRRRLSAATYIGLGLYAALSGRSLTG